VQKPTQALQSVNGPANTFHWSPKRVRTLTSLIYFSWDIFRDPLHKRKFKYQSWYLTPYCGLEVQKPTQALQSIKGPANTFDWNPKWVRTLPSLIYFSWDIYRDTLHKRKFKYQSWYLTPYCGLEVQKPTQSLQSVKGPANTFNWNPKWVSNLPYLIYFNGRCIGIPLQKIKFKYQSWYLTPYYGIEVQKPTQALQSVKCPPNTFDWNSKWVRTLPFLIYFS
jgi:phage shock protein PspC (stress-responsive transcriptional regulator)